MSDEATLIDNGTPEAPEQQEEKKKKRRPLLIIVLLVLLLLLAAVLCVAVRYWQKPAPLTDLPPVQAVVAVETIPPHFLFSIYGIGSPMGVAVTPVGDRIYATEGRDQRMIRVFDRDGNGLFDFAPPNTVPATRAPVYVALDEQGRVYVTDRMQHAVLVFDADGNFLRVLHSPDPSGYWAPLGVTVQDGNIFIADVTKGRHRVMVFDLDGQLQLEFGKEGQGEGEFSFPNSVVRDSRGRLYVSDSNNGRVQVFDSQGNVLGAFAAGTGEQATNLPRGLCIDKRDRLFLADTIGQTIRVWDVSGDVPRFLYTFGTEGNGDGEFYFPNAIAIDDTGRLYITDRANNRIQVWSY